MTDPSFAYHGTPDRDRVLAEGLVSAKADNAPCVWLALNPQDAALFGDVVRVDLARLDGTWPRDGSGELSWQAHYDHDVPADALTVWPGAARSSAGCDLAGPTAPGARSSPAGRALPGQTAATTSTVPVDQG